MIKNFFEFLKIYWGYFMTLVAAVTFVWTLGVKSEKKNLEKVEIKKNIIELKESVENFRSDIKKIDTLIFIVKAIQENQNTIVNNQNSLRDSYVNYLTSDDRLTTKKFIELIKGIEFNVAVPPQQNLPGSINIDTTKTDYKFSIKKINPEENEY